MNKYLSISIFVIVFLIVAVIIYTYDMRDKERFAQELNEEYLRLSKYENIQGVVTNIFIPEVFRNDPHSALITLDGLTKIGLVAFFDEKGNTLDEVLKVGSRLKKKANNDTIQVYNIQCEDTVVHIFIWDTYEK